MAGRGWEKKHVVVEEEEPEQVAPRARIRQVQVDGLVLLKIAKHCKDSSPEPVNGVLLGLDVDGVMEVTNCFPELDESTMKQLINSHGNIDNYNCGWYQSRFSSSFNQFLAKSQHDNWQKTLPNRVVLVYDPSKTSKGQLGVVAYRLTDQFMELSNTGDFSYTNFAKMQVNSTNIFEEIPIKIHNSHLVHGFLYELREKRTMSCYSNRLAFDPQSSIEKDLTFLSQRIDEYEHEQHRFQSGLREATRKKQEQVKRRTAENEKRQAEGKEPLPIDEEAILASVSPPSRQISYLIANQISQRAGEVINTARGGINKLYLLEGLHEEKKEA